MGSPTSDDPDRKSMLQIARSILREVDRQQLGKKSAESPLMDEPPTGAPFLRRMTERHRREGRPTQELIAMTKAVTKAVLKALEAGEDPEITLETIAAMRDCFQKDLLVPEMTFNPAKLRAMVSQLAGGDSTLVELALNIRELYPGLKIPVICFPSTHPQEGHALTVGDCYRMPVQHESFYMGSPYAGPLLYPLVGLSLRVPKHPGDFRPWLTAAHKAERPLVIVAPFYFEFVEHFAKDLSEVLSQPVCLLTPEKDFRNNPAFLEDLAVYLGTRIWHLDSEGEPSQIPELGTAQALAFDESHALVLQGGGAAWEVAARKFRLECAQARDRLKALASQALVFTPGGATPNAPLVACGRMREVIHFLRAYDGRELTYGWPKIFSKAIQDLASHFKGQNPQTPIMQYLKQWVTPQANVPRLDLLTSIPNMRLSIDLATEIAFRTLAQSHAEQPENALVGKDPFDPYHYIEAVKAQPAPNSKAKLADSGLPAEDIQLGDIPVVRVREEPLDSQSPIDDIESPELLDLEEDLKTDLSLSGDFESEIEFEEGEDLLGDRQDTGLDLSGGALDFDEYLDFEEDDIDMDESQTRRGDDQFDIGESTLSGGESIESTLPGEDRPEAEPRSRSGPRASVDRPDATQDQPAATSSVDEVSLGASCITEAQCGEPFTAYFAAYPVSQKEQAEAQLKLKDEKAVAKLEQDNCYWRIGTPVTVTLEGKHLMVKEPVQHFQWRGKTKILAFDLEVSPTAPQIPTQLRFDVFVFGEKVASVRLRLIIGSQSNPARRTAEATPVKTVFASYSSRDRERVLDRVASLQIFAKIDVFLDCKSLRPSEEWEKRLKQEIVARDTFILFWSKYAQTSKWVKWEWEQALILKDKDHFQVHPLDPVDAAPAPEKLGHLHFSDPLMIIRAYEVLKQHMNPQKSA